MKKYLGLLLALALLLSGCGSKSAAPAAAESMTAASQMAPAADAAMKVEMAEDYMLDMAPAEPAEAPMPEPESQYNSAAPAGGAEEGRQAQAAISAEKLIYRANLSMETLDFDAAVNALERMAGALGGFVESSNVTGNTSWQPDGTTRIVDRWADYVLRVPSNRFQEAVNQVGNLGSVTSSGTSVENITSQFTDQEARKHSLEVQEERLLDMLGKAENIDTLIMLESRLSEVRYEIEAIERKLRNWQNQVDYSTISVSLREVAVYTPTVAVQRSFGERMSDSFRDGWNRFVRGLEDLSLALAGSLPGLVLLLVIVVVVILTVRKFLRGRRKKREGFGQPPQEENKDIK